MTKIAVIPVRSGSKRLPKKNYKSFNSRNIAQIARDKCLAAGIFDKVIISSDDPFFEELVNCNEVEFLLRNENFFSFFLIIICKLIFFFFSIAMDNLSKNFSAPPCFDPPKMLKTFSLLFFSIF